MWLFFWVEQVFGLYLSRFGIFPREAEGLIGVVMAPLLHGSYTHIISNTVPMLFLGTVLFYFYSAIAKQVFIYAYLGTGLLVWLLARGGTSHIGASGVVYALASFLIFFGVFRRDFRTLVISFVIVLMYGGLIYGVLPWQPGVSWESHLFGGVLGGLLGYYFARNHRQYDTEE
ncbi:MAG TPA: rhombosortase [Cytophagales bacterium]|nr:rhombosortase [Cytophagales bacterium]HAA18538.1 rhombosortase [Cytophagales bacterium]HAP62940.1 rhombosortase [Cytophagales bacterium]